MDIKTIVMMDDDEDDFLIFSKAVEEIAPNIAVHHIDSFFTPSHPAACLKPDLLFLDLNMPRKDGFEWMQLLRKNGYEHLPIIVYSTSSSNGQIRKAYNLGADLYFVKPSTYDAIVSQVRLVLSLDWSNKEEIKEMVFQINNPHLRTALQ